MGPQRMLLAAVGRLSVDVGRVDLSSGIPMEIHADPPRPADVHVVIRRGRSVVAGARVVGAPLDWSTARDDIRGVVLVSSGRVERATGRGMDRDTTTDALGRAWFRRLPPEGLRLSVVDPSIHESINAERTHACRGGDGGVRDRCPRVRRGVKPCQDRTHRLAAPFRARLVVGWVHPPLRTVGNGLRGNASLSSLAAPGRAHTRGDRRGRWHAAQRCAVPPVPCRAARHERAVGR